VKQPAEDAPAEVEATDDAGETQVVETEAADVETAEAQAEVEESAEEPAHKPSHRAETPDEADADGKDDDKA